jgi:hypothetical protein
MRSSLLPISTLFGLGCRRTPYSMVIVLLRAPPPRLHPTGILHLSIFIMLCKGFLGVPPHYEFWRSLFQVVRSAPGGVHLPQMGAP